MFVTSDKAIAEICLHVKACERMDARARANRDVLKRLLHVNIIVAIGIACNEQLFADVNHHILQRRIFPRLS